MTQASIYELIFVCTVLALIDFTSAISDQDVELPAFVTSFLFQCNLFKLISCNSETNIAQCLVCKSQGKTRYCKGKSTSNYHIHMKVKCFNSNYGYTYSVTKNLQTKLTLTKFIAIIFFSEYIQKNIRNSWQSNELEFHNFWFHSTKVEKISKNTSLSVKIACILAVNSIFLNSYRCSKSGQF